MRRFLFLLTLGLVLPWIAPARAQTTIKITFGEAAQDFPPGPFTDGKHYQVSDFKEKVLVLYFFDGTSKQANTTVGQRAAVVAALKGKAVKFMGVAGNIMLEPAKAFQAGLGMPVFVDSLGLMQARYGFQLGPKIPLQVRVVGATGQIEEADVFDLKKEDVDKALRKPGVRFKYDPAEYDAKMKPALDLLEYGQLGPALKTLAPFTKSGTKTVAEAAKKFTFEIKAEAEKWKAEADELAIIDPLKAYDLYQKAAAVLPGEDAGKAAAAAVKKLAADKSIMPELAARKAYAALIQSMGQVTVAGRPTIMQSCKSFLKKHPGTQTADKVDDLYKELAGKEVGLKGAK